MKKINKITLLLGIFIFCSGSLMALPLEMRWYTKTLNVYEGENIKVNLFIYPDTDPVVTVSNTVVYNPGYLDFVGDTFAEGWSALPNAPYFLTDKNLGMIRRTAGYTSGVDKPAPYVTYEFTAKKVGKTVISLEDGFALDSQNVDIGLQTKTMTINVLPRIKTMVDQQATSTDSLSKEGFDLVFNKDKNINVTMSASGRTAMYEGDDYTVDADLKQLPVTNDAGEIEITLYDREDDLVYSKIEYFQPGETSKKVIIPAAAFKEGDYYLNIKTIYKNLDTEIETTKMIGVLKDNRVGLVEFMMNNVRYIVGTVAVLFLVILFHIHHDHVVVRDIKRRYKKKFTRN